MKKLYVSRNDDGNINVVFWTKKPHKNDEGEYNTQKCKKCNFLRCHQFCKKQDLICKMSTKHFKSLYGFTPRKGKAYRFDQKGIYAGSYKLI